MEPCKRASSGRPAARVRSPRKPRARHCCRRGLVELIEHGLDVPSLDAICARAGYTRGAFYVHFKDREDFFVAVMDWALSGVMLGVVGANGHTDLRTAVARFASYMSNREWPVVGKYPLASHRLIEAISRSEQLKARWAEVLRKLTEGVAALIARAQERGEVRRKLDPFDAAQAIITMGIGAMSLQDTGVTRPGAGARRVGDGAARRLVRALPGRRRRPGGAREFRLESPPHEVRGAARVAAARARRRRAGGAPRDSRRDARAGRDAPPGAARRRLGRRRQLDAGRRRLGRASRTRAVSHGRRARRRAERRRGGTPLARRRQAGGAPRYTDWCCDREPLGVPSRLALSARPPRPEPLLSGQPARQRRGAARAHAVRRRRPSLRRAGRRALGLVPAQQPAPGARRLAQARGAAPGQSVRRRARDSQRGPTRDVAARRNRRGSRHDRLRSG